MLIIMKICRCMSVAKKNDNLMIQYLLYINSIMKLYIGFTFCNYLLIDFEKVKLKSFFLFGKKDRQIAFI